MPPELHATQGTSGKWGRWRFPGGRERVEPGCTMGARPPASGRRGARQRLTGSAICIQAFKRGGLPVLRVCRTFTMATVLVDDRCLIPGHIDTLAAAFRQSDFG